MSEFGAGLVVCLVKFSEHLCDDKMTSIRSMEYLRKAAPSEIARIRSEATRYPGGDSARMMRGAEYWSSSNAKTAEENISRAIELWANGASDHFYDLDTANAPAPLSELAELTLRIGHGFTGELWTWETIEKIHELLKQSAMALDERCGTKPIWGEYH